MIKTLLILGLISGFGLMFLGVISLFSNYAELIFPLFHLPLLIGYLLAKSRDPLSMINLSRSLVRDSWIIELVRLFMKILACALKNKIKNKNFLNY